MAKLVVALSLVLVTGRTFTAQAPSQYPAKAALLVNFLRYVEWPTRLATGPYVICVVGERVASIVAETVKGQMIDDRPVESRVIHEPADFCHIIFAPNGITTARYARVVQGTLTVSEDKEFLQQGGVINFVEVGDQVRFEVNPEAAERAGVRLSSRLLQLRWTGGAEVSR